MRRERGHKRKSNTDGLGLRNPTQVDTGYECNWVEWLLRDKNEKWWVRVPYHPTQYRKMADSYNSVREYGFDPEWELIIRAMAHTLHTKAAVGHSKTTVTELLGPFRLMELAMQAHMDLRNKQMQHVSSNYADKSRMPLPGERVGVDSKGKMVRVMEREEQSE